MQSSSDERKQFCPACGQETKTLISTKKETSIVLKDQKGSNKRIEKDIGKKSSSISSVNGKNGQARELLKFYRRISKRSLFIRRVARLVSNYSKLPILDSSFQRQLAFSNKRRKNRRSAQNRRAQLPPLEQSIVRIKHKQSRHFQTSQFLYVSRPLNSRSVFENAVNSSTKSQDVFFSGDSLTFEFFNTISPLSLHHCLFEFDVFLCGINSEHKKIYFWEHIQSMVSPVNKKNRQNRVVEIWVPQLGNCCDELFLVLDGCVIEDKMYSHHQIVESTSSQKSNSLQNDSIEAKRKIKPRNFTTSKVEISPMRVVLTELNLEQISGSDPLISLDKTKMFKIIAPKRKRKREHSGESDETNSVENMASFNGVSPCNKKRKTTELERSDSEPSMNSSLPARKSYPTRCDKSDKLPNAAHVLKTKFRGTKLIGKWSSQQTSFSSSPGKNSTTSVFQPIYSHNGVILNIVEPSEQSLNDSNICSYEIIDFLSSSSSRNASKGSCHMLQLEVSNEHGFGSSEEVDVVGEGDESKLSNKAPSKTNINIPIKMIDKQVRYFLVNSTSNRSSSKDISLSELKTLAIENFNSPVKCFICSRRFSQIWELAFHLITNYPSLNFKFFPPSIINNCKTNASSDDQKSFDDDRAIRIKISLNYFDDVLRPLKGGGGKGGKAFYQSQILMRRQTLLLRQHLLGKPASSVFVAEEEEKKKKDGSAEMSAEASNSLAADLFPLFCNKKNDGVNFNGILPFNEPDYVKIEAPPYANLHGVDCDRGWIRDRYKERLNQITDVSEQERSFFRLWNVFIGKRKNLPHGQHSLPELIKRFINEFGTQLIKDGLLSNFISHCAVLSNYNFITEYEMDDLKLEALNFVTAH